MSKQKEKYKLENIKGPFQFYVKTKEGLKSVVVDEWLFATFKIGETKFMMPVGITVPNNDELLKHNCGAGTKAERDAAVDWHFHNNLNPITRWSCGEIIKKRDFTNGTT